MQALAELSEVRVTFGRRVALDNISLNVEPGEILTLIGPNGSGKTTLLRVILGLQRPTGGTVIRKPALRVGYMPQRVAIDETLPLTVRRFLAMVRGAKPKLKATLETVGASHTLELPVQTLSGGEMQRVLLARALLADPELLVLDEPAQGVDIAGQSEMFALIRRIREQRGTAILLVSHDLHLVMAQTDRVVCLNHHVCCSGHPEAVTRDPAYLALFGPAAENLALYAHHHDHIHDEAHAHDPSHHHDDHDHAHGIEVSPGDG